jgi:putative transposase
MVSNSLDSAEMKISEVLRLELQRVKSGISWFESAMKIRRVAVIAYLNNPLYTLN